MKKVAVAISAQVPSHQEIFDGVCDFAQSVNDWLVLPYNMEKHPAELLKKWGPDAVIVCTDEHECDLSFLPNNSLSVTAGKKVDDVPNLQLNTELVAELVLGHLMQNGYRSVAYAGQPNEYIAAITSACEEDSISIDRPEVALDLVELLDEDCLNCETLRTWISGQPQHVAVITDSAMMAGRIIGLAKQLSLNIPTDLAVLSIENAALCKLPIFDISAIEVSNRELGFQAGKSISQVFESPEPITLPSIQKVDGASLVARGSTMVPDMDFDISRALRFIEENACRGINVSDVIATLRMSRVTFERRFRESTGRTPAEHIRKIRMERAIHFLTDTDAPIARIGVLCGFDNLANFSAFFKSAKGVSPRTYREKFRKEKLVDAL